jgi:Bacterial Ig-like domain (group 2)
MQRIVPSLMVFTVLSLFIACGGGSTSTNTSAPNLSSIQVSGQNPTLIAGQSEQLKATGSYSNGSTQDLTSSVTWSTSSSNTATIAPGGLLTAKASGQCSVSASSSGVKGSFSLTVDPSLVSISVTPASVTVAPGTTQQLIATGNYSDNSTQNLTTSVSWSSSSTGAATVSSTAPTMGLARAVASGSAIITATLGSVSGTASLTISSASATSIAVTPVNPTLPLGVTQQFTATGTFSDGSTQDVTNVAKWTSSSTKVASITASGFESSANTGTSTISASFGGVSGSSLLTVNAANLNTISIQPANGSIAQGTKQQFTATGTFNDGSTRDVTHAVTWSSSDPTVFAIGSSSGIGSGVAPGLITVTATLGSNTASVPFNVSNATIVSVSVAPASATIPIGAQKTFTAIGTFSDSSTQDITTVVTWASDNTAAATVGNTSANSGLASSVGAGTANISAAFSYAAASATGSSPLTVSSATLVSIALSPTSALLAPASGLQYNAIGTFSDGTTFRINPSLIWSTSDNTIATVNTTGFVTGQSGGIVGVTAQQGSVSATANLLVESAALTSIQVTPASTSVPATIRTQFKATGTFSNGDTQDLTGFVNWTSANSSVATISNAQSSAGSASGIKAGTSAISAVFGGQVGTATLTVTNATLNSLAVTPGSASIPVGSSQQFTATGTFSDGSTFGLTTQADWSSSTASVATVSRGVANGVSSGTATVSASLNGVTGTAVLTVQ